MPYSSGRVVHDADAHIMETPTWLRDYADPAIRDRIAPLSLAGGNELKQTGDPGDNTLGYPASSLVAEEPHAGGDLVPMHFGPHFIYDHDHAGGQLDTYRKRLVGR